MDIFDGLDREINKLAFDYVSIASITETDSEVKSAEFMHDYLAKLDYFKENPNLFGLYDIKDDYYKRKVAWGLLKGDGDKTIVFIHHNDVVGTEDFGKFEDYAFNPEELGRIIKENKDLFNEEIREDIESDAYFFGRGICDMKGGGSIQLALINRYSKLENFKGNILILGVPDEENLSLGARSAIGILKDLKDKYNLDYKLMINSEPHQRKDKARGVFSIGSIGKLMPYVYVRGVLAHAGKVFEGFNPIGLLARIVSKLEVNMDFSDYFLGEAAPAPTWLYMKDVKKHYDVSMPKAATAALSVLTLNSRPDEVLNKFKDILLEAINEHIEYMRDNFKEYKRLNKLENMEIDLGVKLYTISDLLNIARKRRGFEDEYNRYIEELKDRINKGEIDNIESHNEILSLVLENIDDLGPMVIYGLIPPYYPNVCNLNMENVDTNILDLPEILGKYARENFDQEYETENFYTGISDLSYANIENASVIEKTLEDTMALFNTYYKLPLMDIEDISMPTINIGPWGKDFHKLTERVLIEDLLYRTPRLIDEAIKQVLG